MVIVARLVINALVIFLIANYALIPGISVDGFGTALIVAIVLGLINLLIRPILILLTLPITLLTFGLFTLVINALMLWLVSSIVGGFEVSGFLAAFLGALVISAVHWLVDRFI